MASIASAVDDAHRPNESAANTPSKNSSLSNLRASDLDADSNTPFKHDQIILDPADLNRDFSNNLEGNSSSSNNDDNDNHKKLGNKTGNSSSDAISILAPNNKTGVGTSSSSDEDKLKIMYVDIYSWKIKKDEDRNVFVAYLVHVTLVSGIKWIVERRYQQFRTLRNELKKKYKDHEKTPFPSKKWFFNLSESTIKSRLKKLQDYLIAVLHIKPHPVELSNFLHVESNVAALLESSSRVSERLRSSSSSMSHQSISAPVSMHNFTLIKVLGKGSFGKVFLVRPITSMIMMGSDKVFAMKVLKKVDIVKKHQVDHTKTERFILENINHPFVLKLRYAFQTKQKLFMVTDYCSGGELFFHLKKMKKFTESMTTFYAGQISIALKHLHENNIIYRDLKPENILLDSYGNCKITDFGLSKVLTPEIEGKRLTFCGTPEYLAPEVLIMRKLGTTSYSFEVDWWGLGVVCFELMTGWPPFNDRDFSRLCQKILNDPIKFPSKLRISLDGQNIINQLLTRDPAKRLGSSKSKDSKLSFEGLMNHPFFSHINWNDLRACRVTPPFIPNSGKNEEDTRNFDKEFTRMTLKESPGDPSPIDDNVFNNFSFNDNSRSEYSLNGMNSNHLAVPIERDNRPYMSADRDSIVRLSETIVDCSSSPLVTTVRGNQEGDDLVSRMLG